MTIRVNVLHLANFHSDALWVVDSGSIVSKGKNLQSFLFGDRIWKLFYNMQFYCTNVGTKTSIYINVIHLKHQLSFLQSPSTNGW